MELLLNPLIECIFSVRYSISQRGQAQESLLHEHTHAIKLVVRVCTWRFHLTLLPRLCNAAVNYDGGSFRPDLLGKPLVTSQFSLFNVHKKTSQTKPSSSFVLECIGSSMIFYFLDILSWRYLRLSFWAQGGPADRPLWHHDLGGSAVAPPPWPIYGWYIVNVTNG
jgi:hypothetical protein